jgi:hypothetical protein
MIPRCADCTTSLPAASRSCAARSELGVRNPNSLGIKSGAMIFLNALINHNIEINQLKDGNFALTERGFYATFPPQ